MSGVRIEIRPEGIDETLAFLSETAERTDDSFGLFDAIGPALVSSTQMRFEEEKDPEGNPWPDSLRKMLLGGRTLTETGALAASITHEATAGSVAIGTNLIYAAIHQFGGTIRAKTGKGLRWRAPGNGGWVRKDQVEMPRRAFLGLDDGDAAEIRALCADWLGAADDGGGDARQ